MTENNHCSIKSLKDFTQEPTKKVAEGIQGDDVAIAKHTKAKDADQLEQQNPGWAPWFGCSNIIDI